MHWASLVTGIANPWMACGLIIYTVAGTTSSFRISTIPFKDVCCNLFLQCDLACWKTAPLIRKMVDERHSRANLGRGMHGIAARRLFRRCPVSRLPHNRRSGARSFSRRLGKRSTSPVLVHLGRPECVGSPLVDRFGAPRGAEFEFSQVGKSRANAAAGNGA